jgi:WD40 repeat protein
MDNTLPPHPKIHCDDQGNLWLNFGEYGQQIEVACFSSDETRLLTVRDVGIAQVWDTISGQRIDEIRPDSPLAGSDHGPTTRPFEVFIEAASLSPDGTCALLGLNDGTAGLFDVASSVAATSFILRPTSTRVLVAGPTMANCFLRRRLR